MTSPACLTATPPCDGARERLMATAFVLLGVLIALGIRLHGLSREFWLDEYTTAWVVRDGFGPIFERAPINNLSPAYFLIVRLSAELFGYSEAGLRVPSIVAGALLVPAVYLLARRLSVSRPLAAAASLLTALNPSSIDYSLTVRPYALVQLAGALQACAFLALVAGPDSLRHWRGTGRVVVFAVLTAACIYLHTLAVLFFLPELAFCLLLPKMVGWNAARDRAGAVITGLLLCGLLCLPLLPHLRTLTGARTVLGSFVGDGSWAKALLRFRAVDYLIVPLPFALATEFIVRLRRGVRDGSRPASVRPGYNLAFTLLWLILPGQIAVAATNLGLARINVARWLSFSAIGTILAAVVVCNILTTRCARIVFLAVLFVAVHLTGDHRLVGVFAGTLPVFRGTDEYRGYSRAVEFINRECRDDRLILVESRLVEAQWLGERRDELLKEYLLCTTNSLHSIDRRPPERNIAPFRGRNAEHVDLHAGAIARERGCLMFTVEEADADKVTEQIAGMLAKQDPGRVNVAVVTERLYPRVLRVKVSNPPERGE